jgi:SAM-dependent methyltransferase
MSTATLPLSAAAYMTGPLADAGAEFLEKARLLGSTSLASAMRAYLVAHVFHSRERIFGSGEDPTPRMQQMFLDAAAMLEQMTASGFARLGVLRTPSTSEPEEVENVTGDHYCRLFGSFSHESYFGEATELLRTRLVRNGIDPEAIRSKSVLDAGCGGGRYTAAWRTLGAKPAVGVDISEGNVRDAQQRAVVAGLDELTYRTGDVLNLPFADDAFDIVFSNGVLHHTRDWQRGVRETVRVLRPGGLGWVYVIESPGGLFWDSIEVLRDLMAEEDRGYAGQSLRLLGLPANRVFYMLDHVMAPINILIKPEELEDTLRQAGACQIRRLNRGAEFDRIESIHRGDPYARDKYGAGENRYVFSK